MPAELTAIVSEELNDCSPEERALFQRLRTPFRPTPIERFGKRTRVFVVAEDKGRVLFWDDVEEGFEWSVPDPDGVLREFGASQFDLRTVMRQLLDGAAS